MICSAIEIQWLERRLASLLESAAPDELRRVAAITAALLVDRARSAPRAAQRTASAPAVSDASTEWKRAARVEGLR